MIDFGNALASLGVMEEFGTVPASLGGDGVRECAGVPGIDGVWGCAGEPG